MKKILLASLLSLFAVLNIYAQRSKDSAEIKSAIDKSIEEKELKSSTQNKTNKYAGLDLTHRVNDHFVMELGYAGLSGANDTTRQHGLSRQFSLAFMMDKPLESNPHWSVGYGLGFTSSNYYYKNKYIDLSASGNELSFQDVSGSSTNRFKKFKLVVTYLDIPLEMRWSKDAVNPSKSWKGSFGLRPGILLSAYTKGKNAIDASGSSLYGSGYVMKERNSRYFRTFKCDATARVGIGAFSLYGSYSIMSMLNGNAGHTLRPFAIGVAISGF